HRALLTDHGPRLMRHAPALRPRPPGPSPDALPFGALPDPPIEHALLATERQHRLHGNALHIMACYIFKAPKSIEKHQKAHSNARRTSPKRARILQPLAPNPPTPPNAREAQPEKPPGKSRGFSESGADARPSAITMNA